VWLQGTRSPKGTVALKRMEDGVVVGGDQGRLRQAASERPARPVEVQVGHRGEGSGGGDPEGGADGTAGAGVGGQRGRGDPRASASRLLWWMKRSRIIHPREGFITMGSGSSMARVRYKLTVFSWDPENSMFIYLNFLKNMVWNFPIQRLYSSCSCAKFVFF
jgi:hypothetical protein